jgi:hypothetical protein
MRLSVTLTEREYEMVKILEKYYNSHSKSKTLNSCLHEIFYKHYIKDKIDERKKESLEVKEVKDDDKYY